MQTRRTTIKDIASTAGVSTSLVSFVMNNKGKKYRVSDEMTKKILDIARKLNYQPNIAARSLRNGRTRTIGVIVSDISNSFFAEIARYIEDKAFQANYTVIFGSSDESAEKLKNLIGVLLNKGVDGLIIVPCEGSEEIIKTTAKSDVPVVLLDRNIPDAEITHVVLNNRKATALAVNELIKSGFANIEMVSYDLALTNIENRESGYAEAMRKNGLGDHIKIHRVNYQSIAQQTEKIISKIARQREDRVQALIFATNSLTIKSLEAIKKFGMKVPDDIAVVGFDESDAFKLYYTSLSHVRQPTALFGQEAIAKIIEAIEDPEKKAFSAITLDPEIVIGHSSEKIS